MSEDYALVTDISVIVDTCLLKSLNKTDDRALLELVNKSNNRCHLRESKKVLVAAQVRKTKFLGIFREFM